MLVKNHQLLEFAYKYIYLLSGCPQFISNVKLYT